MSAEVVVTASPPPMEHVRNRTRQVVQFGSDGAVAFIEWLRTPTGLTHGEVEIVMRNGQKVVLPADKVQIESPNAENNIH